MKIWFQNRRTKWKKQNNISNAEAAEHRNIERKEIDAENTVNCKKTKVQIGSNSTALPTINEVLDSKEISTTEQKLPPSGEKIIEVLLSNRETKSPDQILNYVDVNDDSDVKPNSLSNKTQVELKTKDIMLKTEKIDGDVKCKQMSQGDTRYEYAGARDNLNEDRPRIPVSLPLVNLVNMMDTAENPRDIIVKQESFQPGFYTEQNFN